VADGNDGSTNRQLTDRNIDPPLGRQVNWAVHRSDLETAVIGASHAGLAGEPYLAGRVGTGSWPLPPTRPARGVRAHLGV